MTWTTSSQGGLRQDHDLARIRHENLPGLLFGGQHDHAVGCLTGHSDNFIMTMMADEQHGKSFGVILPDLMVNLRDERTGGVHHAQVHGFGGFTRGRRDPVSTEQDGSPFRNLADIPHKDHAFSRQIINNLPIMNNLFETIDGMGKGPQHPLRQLDRAFNPRAKPMRCDQDYFFLHAGSLPCL
jgi:hypothetical protein